MLEGVDLEAGEREELKYYLDIDFDLAIASVLI